VQLLDSRDPSYLKALCEDWAVPRQETDLQTLLAHLEVKFLDKVAAIPPGLSVRATSMCVQLLAGQYFFLLLRAHLPGLYANTRPGEKQAKSAADFSRGIDQLVEDWAALVFGNKMWPFLDLPAATFEAVMDLKVRWLIKSETWYIDSWKRRAWEDERGGARLAEDWKPPKAALGHVLNIEELQARADNVANPALLEGHKAVSLRTAREYLGIGPRAVQMAVKKEKLVIVGKGHTKKITVESLLAYLPPSEEKTK